MYVETISQTLLASKTLHNVYAKSVILEGELSSAEMLAAVSKTMKRYNPLLLTLKLFRKILLTTKSVYQTRTTNYSNRHIFKSI